MLRARIWDFWADKYEKLWVQKYSLGPTRMEIIDFLRTQLKKDNAYRILDVGCGTGQLLRDIKKEFKGYNLELSGVDFSREMIQCAESRDGSVKYKVMNVKELSILKEFYDIIICTHSFPYYDDQKQVLKDMRVLLSKDGYVLLAQASQNSFYDALAMFFVKFTIGRAKYPSVNEIKKLAEGSFSCEKLVKIKKRFYMPSIYFFALKGRNT
jgi:ubiquinone/menaquinone biosynthesis C-methylase UbiE